MHPLPFLCRNLSSRVAAGAGRAHGPGAAGITAVPVIGAVALFGLPAAGRGRGQGPHDHGVDRPALSRPTVLRLAPDAAQQKATLNLVTAGDQNMVDYVKDYLAPMFEKEHPSATVKAVGTGKGLIAGPNSSGSNRFAIDSLLEEAGFEPSVPLRDPRAGLASGKVPDTHSVGAIRNHNLGVFTVTEIAMKNTAAVPPAYRLPRTPKAAYLGLQRCRAPSVPLTCLTRLAARQSLCTGHIDALLKTPSRWPSPIGTASAEIADTSAKDRVMSQTRTDPEAFPPS